MATDLLEPLSLYNKTLKNEFHQHAEDYFDELIRTSRVDVEGNKLTVKAYKDALAKLEVAKKKMSKTRSLKVFLIILTVIFFIVTLIFAYSAFTTPVVSLMVDLIIAIASLGLAILMIVLLAKKIKKKLKDQQAVIDGLTNQANQRLAEAQAQMACLNRIFDWNAHAEIVKRATDVLKIDRYFDVQRYHYLQENYGLEDELDEHISTDMIMSGEIVKNPFLLVRQVKQTMGSKTYYGTLTISWTETVRDSNGKSHTVTRTQTLHASVIKPIPVYNYNTFLVYGNEAAKDLHFTRSPSGASGLSEKQIDAKVKKGMKALTKKAKKDLAKNNSGFTALGNEEFDVLFGAKDRDNEVEFRLLFTPFAQKSLLELIKNKEPYGDDFYFVKDGPLNFITSAHSQNQDYYGNPARYISYDLEESKKAFINYNDNLLQGLFFDLAPVLCIPLYQQHEPNAFNPYPTYSQNFTSYEMEVLSNAFDPDIFKHPETATPVVLKSNFQEKAGSADTTVIKAFSFRTEDRLDYVSVYGGDGHYHNVPVPWEEYLPIDYETPMVIKGFEGSREDFNDLLNTAEFQSFMQKYVRDSHIIYQRGLIAFIMSSLYTTNADEELTNLLKKAKINK